MAHASTAGQAVSLVPNLNAPRPGFKLTVDQILERYSVSRSTLNAWIADGIFPEPVKIGGRVFFDEQDIADFERRSKDANSPAARRDAEQAQRLRNSPEALGARKTANAPHARRLA